MQRTRIKVFEEKRLKKGFATRYKRRHKRKLRGGNYHTTVKTKH